MEKKAQELYPNNKTFCGGVAQIARDAFAKGARMQKEVDDKELSEKVSATYQLGLDDKEKQMMEEAVEGIAVINANAKEDGFGYVRSDYVSDDVLLGLGNFKLIIVKEEKNGAERA